MRKAYSYIRMSTETQLKGDSLRRQLEASDAYAKNNQLELVDMIDGVPLKDIGISAFKGKNTQKGVLSLFLDALENGKIKRDSVLLIESLDRLSRDRLSEALSQFMTILNKGVEIVTLADNQRYTKEIINQNTGALFVSLGIMFRANEESEIKSKRLSAVWENKRNKLTNTGRVFSKKSPGWLKYSEETGRFELIEEHAAVVRKIFDMCINTCGLWTITRYLNENKIPVFGNAKIWYMSYLTGIISNRATIGEFQPCIIKDGKREKVGDPISDYYPRVIDEQTYLLAQLSIARRSTIGKGRKGKTYINLFSGITYCGSCGYKVLVKGHGNKLPRDAKYLLCSNHQVRAGCNYEHGWRLPDFEKMMLRHLREINFDDLIDTSSNDKKVSLEDTAESLKLKSENIDAEIERAVDLMISDDLSDNIKQKLKNKISQLENDKKEIEEEIKKVEIEISEQNETSKIFNQNDLKYFLDQLEIRKTDYMFRSSVNQYLTKLIEKIELFESDEVYQPWDMTENSNEVKAFRELYPSTKRYKLGKTLDTTKFQDFYRNYHRRIKVTYKSGIERYILCGDDASIRL